MGNPYIPRDDVHAWVEDLGENRLNYKRTLNWLVRGQRRLAKFVDGQGRTIDIGHKHTAVYLLSLVLWIFDKAGGRVKSVNGDDLHEAEKKVADAAPDLLPLDDGFGVRLRAVADRAQPHLLDEMILDLFDDPELDSAACCKMFLLMWVAVEAIDKNWQPPAGYEGQPLG